MGLRGEATHPLQTRGPGAGAAEAAASRPREGVCSAEARLGWG